MNKIMSVFRQSDGKLQVVVADFEERQCPVGHDGQERSRDNEHHYTRNAICNLLATVFIFLFQSYLDTLNRSRYKQRIQF